MSKRVQFLWIAVIVIATSFLFIFASERLGASAIAGHAISYGPECSDETDAGIEVSVYGELYVESVDVTMKDVCVDNDKLSEFECMDKGVTRTYFSCNSVGAICNNGACVSTKASGDSNEYFALLDDTGFSPDRFTISVGDTVTWINVREEYDSAFLIGAQKNTHIKSEILAVGESFSYTFNEEDVGKNVFVDGILISYDQWIFVE